MLCSRPMRGENSPLPARHTAFFEIWCATPRRGWQTVSLLMSPLGRLGANNPEHDAPSHWLAVAGVAASTRPTAAPGNELNPGITTPLYGLPVPRITLPVELLTCTACDGL